MNAPLPGNPRRALRWVLALTALFAVAVLAQAAARHFGWLTPRVSAEELTMRLAPDWREVRPQGNGPFPLALLFSGCDGPRDNMDALAQDLRSVGWASVIVDSHTPRGLDGPGVWRLVCAGQVLPGAERAGDVAVVLDAMRGRTWVDADRIALIGASHGGWSVLDLLALWDRGRRPIGLSAWPESFAQHGLAGVTDIVALYPYCGTASRAAHWGWTTPVPVLMALVEDDSIVDETDCADLAASQKDKGLPIDVVTLRGVTHAFDQQYRSLFSALEFDAEAAQVLRKYIIETLMD